MHCADSISDLRFMQNLWQQEGEARQQAGPLLSCVLEKTAGAGWQSCDLRHKEVWPGMTRGVLVTGAEVGSKGCLHMLCAQAKAALS